MNKPLPYRITEFIEQRFKEDFLFELKEIKDVKGRKVYFVEVAKDNYIHKLKFDHDGNIIGEEAAEAFPADIHEEPSGDIPD